MYVGGCFAPLLIVMVLARLCNQRRAQRSLRISCVVWRMCCSDDPHRDIAVAHDKKKRECHEHECSGRSFTRLHNSAQAVAQGGCAG